MVTILPTTSAGEKNNPAVSLLFEVVGVMNVLKILKLPIFLPEDNVYETECAKEKKKKKQLG